MIKKVRTLWKNEFIQGGFFFMASSFAIHLMNYLFNFIAGRTLGPKGYGEIVALMSYTSIVLVPTGVFSTFILQKISARGKDQIEYAKSIESLFWEKINKWKIFFLLPFFLLPVLPNITNLTFPTASILYPIILFSLFSSFYYAALQGLRMFLAFSLIGILATFLKLAGALLAIPGFHGISLISLFLFLSIFVPFIFSYYIFRQKFVRNPREKNPVIEKRIIGILRNKQLHIIFLSSLAMTLLNNADVVFVKKFFSATEAGIYSSWSLFAKMILYLLGPILSISFVFFSSKKNEGVQTKALLILLGIFFAVGLATYLVYQVFGSVIIHALFGNKFDKVIPFLPYAAIFGSLYSALSFITTFLVAKESLIALMLPVLIPFYFILLYVSDKVLLSVMQINILFATFAIFVYFSLYLIAFAKRKLKN